MEREGANWSSPSDGSNTRERQGRLGRTLNVFTRFVLFEMNAPTCDKRHHLTSMQMTRCRDEKMPVEKGRRAIRKDGECNVQYSHVPKKRVRFLSDVFTTLIDLQWRYVIAVFCVSFVSTWFLFSIAWYVVCLNHGDFEPNHLPGKNEGWIPCVNQIKDFRSCFLYSVETQQTIGFGARSITEECPDAILLTIVQSLFGVLCQAMMTGLAFAKLSRPQRRKKTLIFSRSAVVSERNGQTCFMFRVGDFRHSHILEAHVRAILIRSTVTQEGELCAYEMTELDLGYDKGTDRVFLVWPLTIVHEITKDSPLFGMTLETMHQQHFEIVVLLDGVNASTGNNIQGRASYLPEEIVWNHRFRPVIEFDPEKGVYDVDYSKFHETFPVSPSSPSNGRDA